MLDLSWSTGILMGVSFLIMGLTGLILPFLIHIWNKVYIWLSIVLMLIVFFYMAAFNETHYKELRRLVGLPYMKGSKQLPAEPPSSPEEVAALLKKTSVTPLVDSSVRLVDDGIQAVLKSDSDLIYTTAASTEWIGGRKSAIRSQESPESLL
jgi:hypothetical protein